MVTDKPANQQGLQNRMLQICNYTATAATIPTTVSSVYDNSCQAPSLSGYSSTNVIPQNATELWANFATCNDNTGLFQNGNNTAHIGMATGDQAAFNTVHEQPQGQPCGALLDNVQHVHPDVDLNWFGDELSHPFVSGFLPSHADDPRLLGQQDAYTKAISITPNLFMGLPDVDQLGPAENAVLGPQYQEPNYAEFLKDTEMASGFDPNLYYQVGFPLPQPFDLNNILPQFPDALMNEALGTITEAQGSMTPSNLVLQSASSGIWGGVSNDWIPPQLPQNIGGALSQGSNRPTLYDDPQPSKRHRNETIIPSTYPNTNLQHPKPMDSSKSIKRSHLDVDPPQDICAQRKKVKNSAQAKTNHDVIPQTFNKALIEVLSPELLKKHSRLPYQANPTQAGDSGNFRVFQLKELQPLSLESKSTVANVNIQSPENVCLQCKIRKKQCILPNGMSRSQSACTRCLSLAKENRCVAKSLCVRPKDLDVKMVDPDVYFDSYLAIAHEVPPLLSTNVQCRIAVHMTYLIKEHPNLPTLWKSSALICNVEELKVKGVDDVAYDMFYYLVFNDLRYGQVLGPHSRRMPSVGIPEGQIPKITSLIRWATSTLALAPNGAVSGLQSPLYQFALLYVEKEHYPLRRLLELALKYIAIYNVCVGQMSLQLSPASPFLYKIPPKLRVQICGPLILHCNKLGEELQESMRKIMYSRNGPDKKEYLPLCIIWWLLMAVYQHNLVDTERLHFSCCVAGPIDAKYIQARQEMLSNLVRTHQATYHALFRRDPKSICPIFDNGLVNLCGIGSEDKELLEKLQSLRIAIRQSKEDATARGVRGRAQDEFETLTDLFSAIDLTSERQVSSSACSGPSTVSANVSEENSQSSKRRKENQYDDLTSSACVEPTLRHSIANVSDDDSHNFKRRKRDRYTHSSSSMCVEPPSKPSATTDSDDEVQTSEVTEEGYDVCSISLPSLELSELSDYGTSKSLAEKREKAVANAKLREYWLARCMLEYNNQEWLFEGWRR